MRYFLGVDFGGGSTKATLMDEQGRICASRSAEYRAVFPQSGYVEQYPQEILAAFVSNVSALLATSQVSANDILAICLDGGTHIAVLMDDHDRVIRPAIYWSDGRSRAQADSLATETEHIATLTFNKISPTWTLPQLMWVRAHEPENFARIRKIRFLKDYIRFQLTNDYLTDSIEAMGSLLVDARSDTWSPYLCGLCGIDSHMLPQIVPPGTIVGTLTAQACQMTNLSPSTRVVVGSTDTVMELLASGAVSSGDATVKLATAGRICVVSPKPCTSGLLVTYKHLIDPLWYPGSATKSCAASLRWFRDTFHAEPGAGHAYQQIDALAATVPAGSDRLFFHPYLQGEITPYQDSRLRASFTGVSSVHTYAHFCRAVMEGVAYSLKDSLDSLVSLGLDPRGALRIIGGGSRSQLWSQIVSDVLGRPLVKVETDDSSIGAAMHAAVATGVFASYTEAVERTTVLGQTILPNAGLTETYGQDYVFYKRIVAALQPIYQEMAQ